MNPFANHSTGIRLLLRLAASAEGVKGGWRLRKLRLTNVDAGFLSSVSPYFLFLVGIHPRGELR